jgi:hypothetical protein
MRTGGIASSPRSLYFLAQGVLTLVWWAVIGLAPSVRRWFAFGDDGLSLLAFLPGDLLFWVGGSLAAAWGERTAAPWTGGLRQVLCGGLACSALHAVMLAGLTRTGWPGVCLMLPALATSAWITWHASASQA